MIFCKTKFLISNVAAEDYSSENKKTVFLFKILMKRRHQVWWIAFVRFDEVTFSLIKFDESLSSFDEMTFSFIKFDESFSSSLMKCLINDVSS
jgi:hypothetical protein